MHAQRSPENHCQPGWPLVQVDRSRDRPVRRQMRHGLQAPRLRCPPCVYVCACARVCVCVSVLSVCAECVCWVCACPSLSAEGVCKPRGLRPRRRGQPRKKLPLQRASSTRHPPVIHPSSTHHSPIIHPSASQQPAWTRRHCTQLP